MINEYRKNGYVLFRGILNQDEVKSARTAADSYFYSTGLRHMATTQYLNHAPLAKIPFHPKTIQAIRSLFGNDFTTFQYYMSQANTFGGWHIDAQSQGVNAEYLYEPDYMVSKCAFYLQDNEPTEWGGGLDVIPGSHLCGMFGHRFPWSRADRNGHISPLQWRLRDWRRSLLRPISLDIKAGDLLIFHACLWHRATPAAKGTLERGDRLNNLPREKMKYLINWEVSPLNKYVPYYLAHGRNLAVSGEQIFEDAMTVEFPRSYSSDLLELIRREKLSISEYRHADPKIIPGFSTYLDGVTLFMNSTTRG